MIVRSILENPVSGNRNEPHGIWKAPSFCLCLFGAVWSFVSASFCMSVPFSMLRVVSSVSFSVSAPPCHLTLGYCGTDFSQTLLVYSRTRLKCNSNTGVSDWPSMGQVLPFVQLAVVWSQSSSNITGPLGSPLQKE